LLLLLPVELQQHLLLQLLLHLLLHCSSQRNWKNSKRHHHSHHNLLTRRQQVRRCQLLLHEVRYDEIMFVASSIHS
jgi:hypothetical protein